MVMDQLRDRGIVDPLVLAAFARVPRDAFVDPGQQAHAYDDGPLPIGHGQTISQPYVVAITVQALRLRARLARAFSESVWGRVDLLAAPVIPEPAPPLEAALDGSVEQMTVRQGRFSHFTRPFNGLGLPALSLPAGFSRGGLPLAFQLAGRPFDEATVLRVGHAYQRVTDWHARQPQLA